MGGPTAVPRVARGSGPPIGPGATVAPGRQLRRPFRHDGPMRLILVRHGQTSSNISRALDTAEPGPDLTDLGRAQAAALSRVLDGAPIGAIYASTLVRTQQTAAPLAAAHGLDVPLCAICRVCPTMRWRTGRYIRGELQTAHSSPPGRSTRAASANSRSATPECTVAPTWNGGLSTTRSVQPSARLDAASSRITVTRSATSLAAAVARAEATADAASSLAE